MKQAKRKKSATAAVAGAAAASVVDRPSLPDADYVEQLLAASAPVVEGTAEVAVEPAAAAAEHSSLCLPDQCLLRDAVEYRQQLLSCLPVRKVTVDAGAVERIDTAFMQVLLAFVRSRPGDVEPVQWVNVSSIFAEAARLLGLHEALALPAAA